MPLGSFRLEMSSVGYIPLGTVVAAIMAWEWIPKWKNHDWEKANWKNHVLKNLEKNTFHIPAL